VTLVPVRQSAFPPSIWAHILVVAFVGALVIAIPTGPEPSVMKVNVRALPSGSVAPSSCRLLNVMCAIGALAAGVPVGAGVGMEEGPVEAEGAGEPEDPEGAEEADPDGITLATEPAAWDGAGDSPEVASNAPAAIISTTQATPSMADRFRQVVSFTWLSPPVLGLRVTRYLLRAYQR
jgi:hypothetical protein